MNNKNEMTGVLYIEKCWCHKLGKEVDWCNLFYWCHKLRLVTHASSKGEVITNKVWILYKIYVVLRVFSTSFSYV